MEENAMTDAMPSIFLRHGNVEVYHGMHNGCIAQYWYSVDPTDCDIDDNRGNQFDVRDLPVPDGLAQRDTVDSHAAIICAAIDTGLIVAPSSTRNQSKMRKPTLQELADLCYSVDALYEWLAYKDYAAKFFGPATRVAVHISEDFDSDIGACYSVLTVDVFDCDVLLEPDPDLLNRHTDNPFTELSGKDEIQEFLDEYVADLPIPFQFGNAHDHETIEIDLTQEPVEAQSARKIWLED
jgi:hypothetical protein